MEAFCKMNPEEKNRLLSSLQKEYDTYKTKQLKLDMSRGKPSEEQLDLSLELLSTDIRPHRKQDGTDILSYGVPFGLASARKLFGEILGVKPANVVVGGNSSLNLMFDLVSSFMTHGVCGGNPWCKCENIKFLCPVPGYDRHFSICDFFGIKMLPVPMLPSGPDMDMVETLVSSDPEIKGIWCIPKYSNPQGTTYSDETVQRFAALSPAAPDFRIFWDNAYAVHELTDTPESLLNLMDECISADNSDLPLIFASTSKISFAGGGVAALAASENNLLSIKSRISIQTIGSDKINQLKHVLYFEDLDGIKRHMEKHRKLLTPKFFAVHDILLKHFPNKSELKWKLPKGGYFISVDTPKGLASEVVRLCAECGLKLTPAGATFPYGKDPENKNIRIAPTYPDLDELTTAMEIFCVAVKLAAIKKEFAQNT
jgi:DNA-binding transcriptional MocR family regulator